MNRDLFGSLKTLAKTQTTSDIPTELIVDGSSITNETEILSHLSKSFFPSAKPLGPDQITRIAEYQKYKKEVETSAPPLITETELHNAVFSLNPQSSSGADGIGLDLIQSAFKTLSTTLLKLYNKCISLSYYPKEWKLAKVTILKKPNKDSYKNVKSYRPISVLNILGKIFEKLLYERLDWIAKSNNWFGNNQHGFRPGNSTETAMHELSTIIENNFKSKKFTAVVFLDISGAFDCTWPMAVLSALGKKGCPLYLLDIIESLFLDRMAIIKTGENTFTCSVPIGCPQGGILSPFLWIILAEELINLFYPFPFKIIGYADDIAIISMHKILEIALSNLQTMCNDAVANCEKLLLDINALKTILMIFTKSNVETSHSLVIKENEIVPSKTTKFVGFELDSKLNWKSHITSKCQATQRLIHMLRRCLRLTWGLDTNKLITLYKAIVIPKLLYGCSVWCHTILKKYCIKQLRTVQRCLLRCITRSFNSVPTPSMLIISNLLPINLKAFEISAQRFFSLNNSNFTPSSLKAIGTVLSDVKLTSSQDCNTRFHSTSHPPWSVPRLGYQSTTTAPLILPANEESVNIFIEAIKLEQQVAVAIVCSSSVETIYTQAVNLSVHTTTIQAELTGLKLALQYANASNAQSREFVIYSGSTAALSICTTKTKVTKTARQCRQLLYDNFNKVSLHLVKIRRGEGHLVARNLAASCITTPEPVDWAPEVLKNVITTSLQKKWDDEWRSGTTGEQTRSFFPLPKDAECLKNSHINHELTQVLTGHCRLNYHFHKIKKVPSSLCNCGKEETINHYLFDCNIFSEQRTSLIEACNKASIAFPPPLAAIPKDKNLWKALKWFILESRRLALRGTDQRQ